MRKITLIIMLLEENPISQNDYEINYYFGPFTTYDQLMYIFSP